MSKKEQKKLYYKIGEVCKLADTEAHVLRYWETEFPMLAPAKNRSGQRIYRARDVEIVLLIKRLLYSEGFTIAGAKKRLPQELRRRPDLIGGEAELGAAPLPFPPAESATAAAGAETVVSAEAKLAHVRAELESLLTLLDRTV